jgi:hypothetical protein
MIHHYRTQILITAFAVLLGAAPALAADKEGGTVIRETTMYISPDQGSQRVAVVSRGRNIPLIMDRSNIGGKPWVHVLAVVDAGLTSVKEVSGWIDAKLLITNATPNGDQIIYGEAADSENQAEQRGGRKHSAEDAMRLYYRIYEYFPSSPLAGEALWRFADIRWQLEKSGVLSRPSAHEMSADLRSQIDDETMREIIKKFPHTKWADLAAYDMIDNKVCGDWKGEASCPEKETEIYEKYVREHPQSPKAAEALYNAAWRQAALVDIQLGNHQAEKAERARKKSLELAQELVTRFPEGDWKPRASTLMYALQQKITIYGSGAASSSE